MNMINRLPATHHQRGLSLVEILVAITVSLILIGGVVQIYANSKQTYRVEGNLSRIQENGRFAIDMMGRDIRMAGYAGCSKFGPITNTLKESSTLYYDFTVGIKGYDNVGDAEPLILTNAGIDPKAGTDVIVVRGTNDNPVRVNKTNDAANVFTAITGTVDDGCGVNSDKLSDICPGDILMVSDCEKSRVFQVTSISTSSTNPCSNADPCINIKHSNSNQVTPGNDLSSWGGASLPDDAQFEPGAEIIKISTYAYYIETVNGVDVLKRLEGTVESELADGVEDLQVEYGLDTSGDRTADEYRTAAAMVAADWENVVTARIHLLIASPEDNVASQAQSYYFYGANVAAGDVNDRRIRQEFTSTITLRNRAS